MLSFNFNNNKNETMLTRLIHGFEKENLNVYHFRTGHIPNKQVSDALLYAIEQKIKVQFFPSQEIVTFVKPK